MAVLWQSTTARQIEWKVTGSPTFRNLHCLTALAVHPALTGIPQIGIAGKFTTELRNTPSKCYPPHNRGFPQLVQTDLFKVEQYLHILCFHTL